MIEDTQTKLMCAAAVAVMCMCMCMYKQKANEQAYQWQCACAETEPKIEAFATFHIRSVPQSYGTYKFRVVRYIQQTNMNAQTSDSGACSLKAAAPAKRNTYNLADAYQYCAQEVPDTKKLPVHT
eukprot:scpid18563/ scgid27891/ 